MWIDDLPMEDREALLKKALGWCKTHSSVLVLRKLYANYCDAFDVLQLGLAKAINSFDASLGLDFSKYAYYRMRNEVLDDLRKRHQYRQKSKNKISVVMYSFDPTVHDIPVESKFVKDVENRDYLKHTFKVAVRERVITDRHVRVLNAVMDGTPCTEINLNKLTFENYKSAGIQNIRRYAQKAAL